MIDPSLADDDALQSIQSLQFTDKATAETLLIAFLRRSFPLDITAVQLRPLAVSLNSFNGFITLATGERLFFKTHTEQDNVIDEYYNAGQLADAGYAILQPLYRASEAGKQILIYPVIDAPSVFDIAWGIETSAPDIDDRTFDALKEAQESADDQLADIYARTLEWQSAGDAAKAPIHQLFYHRSTGGRLDRFYDRSQMVTLPQGDVTMDEVRNANWTINGQIYHETLDAVIGRAERLLNPVQAAPSIIGHGDAHNGNLFFIREEADARLLYFDPAFAGRHDPLLDLTKPLFHNVFAMWMYFPIEKTQTTSIDIHVSENRWAVDYVYDMPPLRQMFLASKIERVLIPTLKLLRTRGWLRPDWRAVLKSALFCCPFLTLNLTDSIRFTPAISLLGLCMAMEMGSESDASSMRDPTSLRGATGTRSRIDQTLDQVATALARPD